MTSTGTALEPRVWVGCLACYNAGRLVGAWMPAADGPDYVPEGHGIACGRCWAPAAHWPASSCLDGRGVHVPAIAGPDGSPHEEQWVFDHEGFGGFLSGECSPSEAARVAEVLEAIEADGLEVAAVAAWAANVGEPVRDWAEVRESFEESFCGTYSSGADYAEELAEELGAFMVGGDRYGLEPAVDVSDRWPMTCIDWERAWRDLELGDGYWTAPAGPGEVFVFRPG